MITDEEIDDLPDDDEAAFVQYEAILREAVRKVNSDQDYRTWDVEREYVAHMLAFVDNRDLPVDLPRNPPDDDQYFSEWHKNFVRAVDYFKASARLQVSARRKRNVTSIALSLDLKTQVGGHLTAIRNIVGGADLSENKRDAIFRRIADLQEEVDRDRTRTEAALALWLDVTTAVGKGADNLKPVLDRIESIMKVFAKARDENEQKALSGPKERKRIAAPTTPAEQPAQTGWEPPDSDELPF